MVRSGCMPSPHWPLPLRILIGCASVVALLGIIESLQRDNSVGDVARVRMSFARQLSSSANAAPASSTLAALPSSTTTLPPPLKTSRQINDILDDNDDVSLSLYAHSLRSDTLPFRTLDVLVAGAGYSGTGFSARALSAVGFDVGHELVFSDGSASWPFTFPLWLPEMKAKRKRPYFAAPEMFRLAVVQLRSPLEVLRSAGTRWPQRKGDVYVQIAARAIAVRWFGARQTNSSNLTAKVRSKLSNPMFVLAWWFVFTREAIALARLPHQFRRTPLASSPSVSTARANQTFVSSFLALRVDDCVTSYNDTLSRVLSLLRREPTASTYAQLKRTCAAGRVNRHASEGESSYTWGRVANEAKTADHRKLVSRAFALAEQLGFVGDGETVPP